MDENTLAEALLEFDGQAKSWLLRNNTWVDDSTADDILSEAKLMVIKYCRRPDSLPISSLGGFYYNSIEWSVGGALKRLMKNNRAVELQETERLEANHSEDPPVRQHRQRQGFVLSDAYREFVKYCEDEKRGRVGAEYVWLRRKEVFERVLTTSAESCGTHKSVLRGMVTEAMITSGWYPTNPVRANNLYDSDFRRAVPVLHDIMKRHDSHGTIFETVWRDLGVDRDAVDGSGQVASRTIDEARVSQSETSISTTVSFRNFRELARWVVSHTDAFCPSRQRLDRLAALQRSDSVPSAEPVPRDLLDVVYHVRERGCIFCTHAIQDLKGEEAGGRTIFGPPA